MKYRQIGDESIDDFVTRARTLANKCQFTANELNERLMELIIASTPCDGLRRELLGKPIGRTIKDVLKEGRKFEALSAGNDQLQRLDTKQSDIQAVSYVRKCGNCGTSHRPRQCPAYKDKCSACNAIGHWKACCRKTRTQSLHGQGGYCAPINADVIPCHSPHISEGWLFVDQITVDGEEYRVRLFAV